MPALDFKEIATAQGGPERDQFELFAREFLVLEGFTVAAGPDRGPDGGRDLVVEEARQGPGGRTDVRWLVSCKHKAHSGNSVTPEDESNIRDRLGTHACTGFIAFYSTLPSSGLARNLEALKPRFECLVYDPERIERRLLETQGGLQLARRFMPRSFAWWAASHPVRGMDSPAAPSAREQPFFLREPHADLAVALREAGGRKSPVFCVIFDPAHPTRSKLNYALGYFMEYQATKRLVDEHFVAVVGPSSAAELSRMVPDDDPLELCLWVVLDPSGRILRREGVYANPDEGLKRVREVIRQSEGGS